MAIAKEAGYVISAEDLQRAQAEISEDELEVLAGGVVGTFAPPTVYPTQCPAHC